MPAGSFDFLACLLSKFRSGLVHPRYIVAAVVADVSLADIVELAVAVA
jgi:hypothetical protein